MILKRIHANFSVCKVPDYSEVDVNTPFCFTEKTDEENSLVCLTASVPEHTIAREDGWKAFRIEGILDFSLIGILSKILAVLAEKNISAFVISTYNTDYVLVKAENYEKAFNALADAGYEIQ